MNRWWGVVFGICGLVLGCTDGAIDPNLSDDPTLYSTPADTVGDKQRSSACDMQKHVA